MARRPGLFDPVGSLFDQTENTGGLYDADLFVLGTTTAFDSALMAAIGSIGQPRAVEQFSVVASGMTPPNTFIP